jgi:hypothetical protein
MKIKLCAGGGLLGTVPARALLFTGKGANGRTISKAVSVPEDALPKNLAPSTDLLIVPLSQLKTVESIAARAETEAVLGWEVTEAFMRIAAIMRLFTDEDDGAPVETVEPRRAAADTLENYARELARAGLNEIASAIISLVGAIHGGFEQDFARFSIEAAAAARARKDQGLTPLELRPPLAIEREHES